MRKLAFSLLAISVASSACSIDVQGEESVVREQRRFAVTGTPGLTVRTFDGSIEIRPWERAEILVDIERRAGSEADARAIVVDTSHQDGVVRIEAKHPGRDGFFEHAGGRSPTVRMLISVPRRINVDARTGDGAIRARDVNGRIELRTGDGSVRLQGVEGDITISTGNGAVTADQLQGRVAVSTGDGSVNLSGRLDELTARTGDGAIDVDALPGSTMKSDWAISTGDGSVRLRLPAGFNAEIDAHTGDGGIATSGVAVVPQPGVRDDGRRDVRGRVGSGGQLLTIRTGDGAIDVRAQ
jgi:hypothetical protein